jgi:hypothetical protein
MVQYDNMINQAKLSNNEALAEIAFNYAKAQAQYALEGFQYKNTLIESKQTRLAELGQRYDTKYQNMLNQINNELAARRETFYQANNVISNYNKLKQDQDQWEKQMAYQRERDAIADAQWERQYNLSASKSSGGGSSRRSSGGSSNSGIVNDSYSNGGILNDGLSTALSSVGSFLKGFF